MWRFGETATMVVQSLSDFSPSLLRWLRLGLSLDRLNAHPIQIGGLFPIFGGACGIEQPSGALLQPSCAVAMTSGLAKHQGALSGDLFQESEVLKFLE
jgi:hypothetical protein